MNHGRGLMMHYDFNRASFSGVEGYTVTLTLDKGSVRKGLVNCLRKWRRMTMMNRGRGMAMGVDRDSRCIGNFIIYMLKR